jgi:hypothetical protein
MEACKCRSGVWCCEEGKAVIAALNIEFRRAMATGDWNEFQKKRLEFETHMRGESSGDDHSLTRSCSGVRFSGPVQLVYCRCKQTA